MSFAADGQGIPLDSVPEAAGAITPFRVVYQDGSDETAVLSVTSQIATAELIPMGVFYGGGSGTDGAAANGDTGLDVRIGPNLRILAGATLVRNARWFSEYSATAASAGRALPESSVTLKTDGTAQYSCGRVEVGAEAGEYATVTFAPETLIDTDT